MHPIPPWLTTLSAVSLAIAGLCALGIAIDEFAGRRQKMWIMNIVWPVTALWSGPLGLVAYMAVGRAQSLAATRATRASGDGGENGDGPTRPFWQTVGVAATHCGSGCALADLTVEWAVVALPVTFFGSQVFGAWLVDFVAAFLIGILFQYFTIAPMRHLSVGDGILAAVKADALSLTSWQLGMYGCAGIKEKM